MMDPQELRKYSYCSVNIALALVHAAVFAVCLMTGDRLYTAGQCVTVQVIAGREYYRLFTSIFLHSGIWGAISWCRSSWEMRWRGTWAISGI